MSNITLDELRPLLGRELLSKRGTLVMVFAISALLFLALATGVEKKLRFLRADLRR